MQAEPFRIEPTFSPRIWGARTLAPIFPEKNNLPEPIGEAWLTDVNCRIGSGQFVGATLKEAWAKMPAAWRGRRCVDVAEFPLLVKFIFPTDKLSIQVHPDDAYAAAHERAAGGRGKTEMWHAVHAEPGSALFLGLKPGVSKQEFAGLMNSAVVEELFQEHAVAEADTFFVPAGVPHSIGPGAILCEVQEYSDLTYRVYDYDRHDPQGRPRELHIEKAMQVMRFGGKPIGKVRPVSLVGGKTEMSLLAACRYFATERWQLREPFNARTDADSFNLFVVLSGIGRLRWAGGEAGYRRGACWFVPASLPDLAILPEEETALIRTFVPDLDALRRNLRDLGADQEKIADVVFN